MKMKKMILLVNLIAILCLVLSACSGGDSQVAEIKARGELRVGVKVDVPRFGCIDPVTGALEGLEIDIARALAADMLGDENAISFVPVTALTRETLLTNKEIDLVIATFTITEERAKIHNFSVPYYTDEIGFLVRRDSGITSLAEMEGKLVGVTLSSTAFNEFPKVCEELSLDLSKRGFASYPEVKNELLTGSIDVFLADKSILYGYLDGDTVLLDEGVRPQDYGIATRLEDREFAKYIDDRLRSMTDDGSLDEILGRWIG